MIKSVIEKIILNNFGKFINGIQKDKLSVDIFGGNFKLENISLNHEYFDSLNTPFKLVYSSIGKLNLTASLSKLSSVPVECVLDNIYVIFQFRPQVSKQGKQEVLQNQKQSIKNYIHQMFNNYLQKVKQDKKEDGMITKLGKKIIDNLQMKIINLHLRFEESRDQKYAWGLTLQEMCLITANDKWQPTFIDRDKEASSNERLYKKLNVKSLSLYWETPSNQQQAKQTLINQYPNNDDKRQRLLSMIDKNSQNSIINITSQFKLIMNNAADENVPLYQLDISLQPIKFELDRVQVAQMIDFMQKNVVKNQMILRTVRQNKKFKLNSQQQALKLKQKFKDYVEVVILCQQDGIKGADLQLFQAENKCILQEVFKYIQMQELMAVSMSPIKKVIKKIREEQLKKRKRGWFGSADIQLDQNQLQELQKFVQTSFDRNQQKKRAQSSLLFCISSSIAGGSFKFLDRKINPFQNQIIQFEIGPINLSASKSSDPSFVQFSLSVKQIALGLILPKIVEHKYTQNKLQILKNQRRANIHMNSVYSTHQKFISLVYKKQSFLPKNQETVPKVVTTVFIQMQRIVFIYKKIYFKKFKQFFKFQNLNQYMKQTTIQKLQNLKQKQKVVIEQEALFSKIQNTFQIRISVISPKIICPFNQKQCWCFSLGDLKVTSQKNQQRSVYPTKITSAYLRYYSDFQTCLKFAESQSQNSSSDGQSHNKYGTFSVINDMNFDILYESNKATKTTSTQIQLPQFQLNFSRLQYQNLLTIKSIFTLDIDEKQTIIQHLKKSRLEIEQQKIYEGVLNVKNQDLGTWKTFHGILAADFIYLYENKKELKQTLKIYVKNCSTCILGLETESSQKNKAKQEKQFQLQLISSQQYCHFSCGTLQQIQKWEQYISKKANQFKTISQLMQFYENSDNKSVNLSGHSRKKSATNLTFKNQKKDQLRIKIAKIGFKYQDLKKVENTSQFPQKQKFITLMNFQIHKVQIRKTQQQNLSSLSIQLSQIKIIDEIFCYKDQKFQTFLMIKNLSFKSQKIKTKKVAEQESKFHEKQKYPIKNYIIVQDLKVNWKPDVILIVLELANKHFSKEQKYRMDDQTQKARNEYFDEIWYDAKYMFGVNQYSEESKNKFIKHKRYTLSRVNKFIKQLLIINVKIGHTQAFFIHRQSHLAMFRFQSNQIHTQYVLGQHEKFISGRLGTISLEQMNSYPQKTYDYEEAMKPFCFARNKSILGKAEQKPVVSFYYSNYEPAVLPNEQRVDSFVYVQIQPIQVVYFQQIVFRLIDYCLIQIMLLINQPQMLTVNENLMQQLKRKEQIKEKPVRMLFSRYQQIVKKLFNPFFMDMYFEIKHPQIFLKAQKSSEHFYKMNFDSIKIQNKTLRTSRRFDNCQLKEANDYIYQEEYSIKCSHFNFEAVDLSIKDKETKNLLLDSLELNLVFNKLQLQDELNLIYPELGSKPELEYDRSFIITSEMSDIIIPSCSRFEYLSINKLVNFNLTFDDQCDECFIHNFKVTKLLLPKPIVFTLEVSRIIMNANYKAQEDQPIKLFKADIRDFKYQYQRRKDLDSWMIFKFGDTQIIGYRYKQPSNIKLNLQIHEKSLIHLKTDSSLFSTQISIHGKTTGQKVIQMTTKSVKVNLQTGLLQLILQYGVVQDWIFPVVSKTVPEMTFFATIQDMNAELEDDPEFFYQLKPNNQILQNAPAHRQLKFPYNLRFLKLCGVLSYKFHRKKTFSNRYLKEMLQKKQITIDYVDKLPQQTYMNLTVNTQLYHCYRNTKQKRKIMDKFTFNMNEKSNLRVSKAESYSFKKVINRTFNLSKCFFKVSVLDLLLMKDLLQTMQIKREYIIFLNKMIGKSNQQDEFSKNVNNQLSTLDSMNLNVSSMSFYLINSWKQVFIPIINFKIEHLNLTSSKTFKKDIMQGDFYIMLNYFNSFIFRWEPALERVKFSFFKQTNKIQNSRKFAGMQSVSPLILNISKQMFISMKQTVAAWNTQSCLFNNRFKSDCSSNNEPIQFISHYIIRNQTGYPLQIFCLKQLKYELKNLEQVNHQMQLQDFEQEMQKDVVIEFNIIHPLHKFKKIGNVSVNAQKEYIIKPILLDGNSLSGQSKISIKPIKQSSKQLLVIGSTKKVNYYFDNQCVTSILAFDSPGQIKVNQALFGQKIANLYKTKQTKTYKFVGQNGTLTITPKYLVFNYTPIPLQINQKIVKPNQYTGVFDKPTINGQEIKDSILRVEQNQKEGHFYVFCEAYIVDYFGLYFDFGTSDQVKKLYAAQGQKNGYKYFIYILPGSEFKFKVKISQKAKQHQTLKSAIGQLSFQLRKGTALCNFSASCYLNPYKNQHLKEFNRVIQITPTYVLSNTTKDTLKICQKGSLISMNLKPQERCPFFWQSVDRPKLIKISAFNAKQIWGYSGPLEIFKCCQTVVLRKDSDPAQYRIFSIHIERTNTITFVHIFQAASKYKIANQIKGTLMTVFQSCLSQIQAQNQFMSQFQSVFNVKFGQQKDFGYDLPIENHSLTIQIYLDKNQPRFRDKYAQSIVIQDIQSSLYVKKILLYNEKTKKKEGYLTLVLQFQGNVKKLKLLEQEKQISQELNYEYSIKIVSFGISLIGMHDDFRRQIIFCLFQGVDLQLTGNKDFQGYELLIQGLRVQNQLRHNVCFPTILQSQKTKQANFFIQFILNRDPRNSKFIRSIGLAVNRTIITVTSQELQALQENLTQIFSIKISAEKQKQKLMIREYQLFKKEVLKVEQSYYFQQAQIQPLKLILTFKHVNNWGGRLLKTFSSMDQSSISVDGNKMTHFNAQNISIFMKSVQQSYKQQILKNIIPLIGNLSILGSPVSLVQKIGSGFKDLIQLPAQQFQNGPLGIGKGIAKGTRSLVKNTFQGAMSTVQSFTGSIGNGLTALVDDQQFQKKRQEIKNQRTQHVGEGLMSGAKSILNGFSKGITGLITQPVKGAQKGGLTGFLMGGFKGITGLVIKPVSGIIDATTKAAQGIKNTANFLSPSQRQKRLSRVHKPRPFYSNCREFRQYDCQLAQITEFLQKHGDIKVPLSWVGCYNLKSSENKKPIMLLTYEYLIFLDLKRNQIIRQYHSQDLVEASKHGHQKFRLAITDRKMQYKQGHIDLQAQGSNATIVAEINKLVKFYRPKFTFK